MLDRLLELGVRGVEMTTGGWSPAPHLDTDDLLANPAKRRQLQQALASRGMEIAALNVSGNPLDPGELGQRHQRQTDNTLELAGLLGVKKIVMMSGLPRPARMTPSPIDHLYRQLAAYGEKLFGLSME